MKNILLVVVAIIVVFVVGNFFFSSSTPQVIQVSGSTSTADYMAAVTKEYKAKTGVDIEYQAIGSTAGIENANNDTTTFGTSSRSLKDSEKA